MTNKNKLILITIVSLAIYLFLPILAKFILIKKLDSIEIPSDVESVNLTWFGINAKNVRSKICNNKIYTNFENISVKIGLDLEIKHIRLENGSIDIKSIECVDKKTYAKSKRRNTKFELVDSSVNLSGNLPNTTLEGVNINKTDNKTEFNIESVDIKWKANIKLKNVHILKLDDNIQINSKELMVNKLTTTLTTTKTNEQSNEFDKIWNYVDKTFPIESKLSDTKYTVKFESENTKINDNEFSLEFNLRKNNIEFKITTNNKQQINANIVYEKKNDTLNYDLNLDVKNINVNNKLISDENVILNLQTNLKGKLEKNALIGTGIFNVSDTYTTMSYKLKRETDQSIIELEASLQDSPCQKVINSIPSGMKGKLEKIEVEGTFGFDTSIKYYSKNKEKSDAKLNIKMKGKKWSVPNEMNVKNFKKPFEHIVYDINKNQKSTKLGPGTKDWFPIGAMSRFITLSITTTEDPGYGKHAGVIPKALENSLIENLKSGRFVRGGSTIPMQLAKNLWLGRKKNIARKIQELFLSSYLVESITQEELLELYLNIIEYGPNVYGIKPASEYYFDKNPSNLSLSQSLFIASILPNPNKQRFDSDGKLNQGALLWIKRVMKSMLDNNKISEIEYERGMQEWPKFKKSDSSSESQKFSDEELKIIKELETH
jgi:hypothetical protein